MSIEPVRECEHCGWKGTRPSYTEDKIVMDVEGRICVVRPIYAVCPECFNRLPPQKPSIQEFQGISREP